MRGGRVWIVAAVLVAAVLLVWALTRDGGDEQAADPPSSSTGSAEPDATATGTGETAAPTEDTVSATDGETVSEAPVTDAEGATPRDDVAATASPEQVAQDEAAADLVDPVIDVSSEALTVPTEVDWDAVVSVTGGNLLSDVESTVLEYTENGWTQEGTPELVSSSVLEVDEESTPAVARVEVCLDYSPVTRLDANGESLTDPEAEQRVRSIFSLEFVDGRWVAVDQAFEAETSC
ncbi:hypothetical protein [Serinicoccus profundi]|uniref:hypothetical protein n=1 Tax=Serinicoccus profundi TaxID=1078471 RepID=UPI000255EA5F|nr:hypothetical protein [Serinicoccus profundi]